VLGQLHELRDVELLCAYVPVKVQGRQYLGNGGTVCLQVRERGEILAQRFATMRKGAFDEPEEEGFVATRPG
jgi:hypothetical protein